MKTTSNNALSAPLQQLKDEHVSLRAGMDLFYDIAEDIEGESGDALKQLFANLYERVLAFNYELKKHSNREDHGLFPMMSHHLEEGDTTIEQMEEEHEKAEQHLQDFLSEEDQLEELDEDDIHSITVYAVQAYATLTQHFAKEEKALFPLAEEILSDDEKEELKRLFMV